MPSLLNVRTKQGSTVSVSNISDIASYRPEISRFLPVYTTSFGQFTTAIHFSNYEGEAHHFMLDVLKKSYT